MKDPIDTSQPRITRRINEEGRDEMDLERSSVHVPRYVARFPIKSLLGTHVPVLLGPRPIPLRATIARTCTDLRRM